jgi:flagella basal body P-ring formation protein FlgA
MKPLLKILLAAFTLLTCSAQSGVAQERVLPVPVITIYPGDTIKESMIRDRGFPYGYSARYAVVDASLVLIGKVARRTLLPGEPIPINAVDEPKLVTRGIPTQVIFEENGLTITTVGSPLENGGLGEYIRVRNTDTGRIIMGTVQADGKIRIGDK